MDRRTMRQMLKYGTLASLLGLAGVFAGCDAGNLNQTVVPPPPAPTVNFSAPSPSTVAPGGSFTLSWTTTNAKICTASGGSGADTWNGSEPLNGTVTLTASNTPGNYNYTLTCTGDGNQSSTGTAAVTVSAPAPGGLPIFTVPLTATPNSVGLGGTFQMTWATDKATSCAASGTWSGNEPTVSPSPNGVTVTAPSTAGVYAYVLTCTGDGGNVSQIVNVTVGSPTIAPPAFTTGLTATPSTVPPGGNFSLSWATSGATSCTASAGSGSDGWNGSSQPTSSPSGGVPLTAPTTPGSYSYVLTCAGAGGSTAQSTVVTVSASAQPIPTFTQMFTAAPSSVAPGATVTLTWATTGAAACSASGGSGSDGWTGSQPTSSPSGGVKVPASMTAGVYTYALTCFGAGGSAAQTASVTVGPGAQPPVITTALTATPSSVTPGATFKMTWATTGATSCTASGGDGGASWSGSVPTSSPSGGLTVTASNTAGSYAYVLTCTGAGGSSSSIATVTVGGFDCAIPQVPTHALLAPTASVVAATTGPLCLVCSVDQPGNVIDTNPLNFAAIHTDVQLLAGSESLMVINDAVIPAGGKAGFVITNPNSFLTVALLQSVTVSTLLDNQVQETAGNTASDPLKLDLLNLGLIGSTTPAYLSFQTSKPYNKLLLTDSPLVGVLSELDVYHACVSN